MVVLVEVVGMVVTINLRCENDDGNGKSDGKRRQLIVDWITNGVNEDGDEEEEEEGVDQNHLPGIQWGIGQTHSTAALLVIIAQDDHL